MKDENERTDLSESLARTIADAGLRDAVLDVAEAGMDQLLRHLQDEVINHIPVLKVIYSFVKTGIAVRDYLFLKKLFKFLAGLREMDEEMKERISRVLSDEKERIELSEQLLVSLERFEQVSKAEMLFRLFAARVRGELSHIEFMRLAHALDRIDYFDLDLLKKFYGTESFEEMEHDAMRSFAFVKLVSVDYSGALQGGGQMWPRAGGGGERFLRNDFGLKFTTAISKR